MKNIKLFSLALIALSLAAACKKDENTTPPATDVVTMKIEHTWSDSLEFALNETLVHPSTGDSLNFVTFKYYISNIRLKKADGTWWVQPESYHLLDLTESTTAEVALNDVPLGEYTDIEYVLGVDSIRNVSGAQTGDLSTSFGMFWSWNSGYIMLKAEGTSPDSGMGSFSFHLGGFSGVNNVVTTKTHNFTGNNLTVAGNGNCRIHLSAAPETLWSTVGSVSGTSMIHMPGSGATTMATDFYGSFIFEHIYE